MERAERMELLARIARGEETEEKMGKEGPSVCAASIRDRLAALRMIAEMEGDLERAKRQAAGDQGNDDCAAKSEEELVREAAAHPKVRQLALTWKAE